MHEVTLRMLPSCRCIKLAFCYTLLMTNTVLTEKEVETLKGIAAQMVLTFKKHGISEPTPEQISAAFVAQCKRNIDLCSIAVYGHVDGSGRNYQEEQKSIVSGLSREVYTKIRAEEPRAASYNPRYLAYCNAQGHTPEEQLKLDGNMTEFLIWSSKVSA